MDDLYKNLVRDYVSAFNDGKIDVACSFFAPDAVIHGIKNGEDPKEVYRFLSEQIAAFETKLEIIALCAEGSTVAARYIERGKFVAPYRGVPPTGRSYEIQAMHWFDFAGDKIACRWASRNLASLYWQIGVTIT